MAPIDYTIDPTRRVVRVAMLDASAPAEVVDLWARILQDPAYRSGFDFLIDRRALTAPPRADTMRALAAFAREYSRRLGPCRMAIVTTAVTGQWSPWRTGATLLAHYARITLELFDDYEAAEDWLASTQ
ncbi:MAG: hypothetical protein ABIX28_23060 [Vicinamibacterales bacterium]